MENPSAILKFVELQLAPLQSRIAELEREVAKLKTEQQQPGILQRLGLKGRA